MRFRPRRASGSGRIGIRNHAGPTAIQHAGLLGVVENRRRARRSSPWPGLRIATTPMISTQCPSESQWLVRPHRRRRTRRRLLIVHDDDAAASGSVGAANILPATGGSAIVLSESGVNAVTSISTSRRRAAAAVRPGWIATAAACGPGPVQAALEVPENASAVVSASRKPAGRDRDG